MPRNEMPDTVVRNVTNAASRSRLAVRAADSEAAMVGKSASPASTATKTLGAARNRLMTAAPKIPKRI